MALQVSGPSAVEVSERYEAWMRANLPFFEEGHLAAKHEDMKRPGKGAAFRFLRGTFYLWSLRFPQELPDLVVSSVPEVLGLGDVHIENFGMWRDNEGRLIWGANDIDEATTMPYTQDLVRLMTSAALAGIDIDVGDIVEDITSGYQHYLEMGARPFVLAHADEQLWQLVRKQTNDPVDWWSKLENKLEALTQQPGVDVKSHIKKSFPGEPVTDLGWHTRSAGMGSLGRPRIVAVGQWRGGRICREAKAALPSAWDWAKDTDQRKVPSGQLLTSPNRAGDPYAALIEGWSIRRLAPDSDKIDIDALKEAADRRSLLRSMGGELANIHLAYTSPEPLHLDLAQTGGRLLGATQAMVQVVRHDQEEYAAS